MADIEATEPLPIDPEVEESVLELVENGSLGVPQIDDIDPEFEEEIERRNGQSANFKLLVGAAGALAISTAVAVVLRVAGNRRNPNQTTGGWREFDPKDLT